MKRAVAILLLVCMMVGLLNLSALASSPQGVTETDTSVTISCENYTIQIIKDGFRYGFYRPDGSVIVGAHSVSGICFGKSGGTSYPVRSTTYIGEDDGVVCFTVTNENNDQADVKLHLFDRYVQFEILPIKGEEDVDSNLPDVVETAPAESTALLVSGSKNSQSATVRRLKDSIETGDDYTVEARVKLPENGTRSAGIFAHYNAENGFHLLFIKPGAVTLKRLNADGSSVEFTTQNPVDVKTNTWYTLKLVCQGRGLKGYVDGQLVVDVTDDSAANAQMCGTAGIRTDKMDAYFDDFKVTSNDGATVYYENNFENATADGVNEDLIHALGATGLEMAAPPAADQYLELSGSEAMATIGESGWKNYTLSARMALAGGDEQTTHGLVFRYRDKNNYYGFRFGAQETLTLYKVVNGTETVLQTESCPYEFDKEYNVKVEAFDSDIACYVDDTQVLRAADSTFSSGKVGVRTTETTSMTDDFKVISQSTGETLVDANFDDGNLGDAWSIVTGTARITDGSASDSAPASTEIDYYVIDARLAGGIEYMYGLGDYGALGNTGAAVRTTSNVAGVNRLSAGSFTNWNSVARFISNFSIAPQLGFAQVLFETDDKRVAITDEQTLLGAYKTKKVDGLYYFFGTMEQIYSDYKQVRNAAGYVDTKPHYEMFGLGWEAFGALGWNAYEKSVMQTLTDYLQSGYNITWGVIGSGFWTGDRSGLEGTTTSFGMWDDTASEGTRNDAKTYGLPNPRFPDPDALKEFFSENDIKLLVGIRNHLKLPASYNGISYGGKWDPTVDGDFVQEALDKGYFLTNDDGSLYTVSAKYPTGNIARGPVGVIDAENPEAVAWFSDQADLWGVDGFKEDCMMLQITHHDDNWNKLLQYMAEEKDNYLIVRNASYCLPGDILRINDANYGTSNSSFNNSPDRMVINALAYAASGQSNVYPDIIGGTGANINDANHQNYIVRNAYMAALCPSVSVGINVLKMADKEKQDAAFKAINWHSTYAPYIYDAALKSYETGYPLSMTPLYIAYPDDENTYDMINSEKRMFQWMLGESVLAAPLFGSDHLTATSRDVYLPEGKWIQYDTGEVFYGPVTLKDWESPIDTMPAFIGGKGVLVGEDMENKGNYFVEVFPIADKGSVYTYTFVDGETVSTVTNNNDGWAPSALEIWDTTTTEKVDFTFNAVNGSFKFAFTKGHDYELRGGEGTGALTTVVLTVDSQSMWVEAEKATRLDAKLDDGSTADLSSATVVYASSDETVATVDENGVITGRSAGTASITATVTLADMHGESVTKTSEAVSIEVLASGIEILQPAEAVNDSFDGSLTGWTDHTNDYTINAEGQLVYQNTTASARGTIVMAGMGENYVMEMDVTPDGLTGGKTFGFTFRYQDSDNNYLFVYTPGTGIRFLKRANNSIALNTTNSDVVLEEGETYHFKAVVEDNHFVLYIGDEVVLDVKDETGAAFTGGSCGMYTSGQKVAYDNVIIQPVTTSFPTAISGRGQSGSTVRLSFADYEEVVPLQADGTWTCAVNHLGAGTYTVTAQLLDKNGVVLAQDTVDMVVAVGTDLPDLTKLSDAIAQAKATDVTGATEASKAALDAALAEAERIYKSQALQAELDAAADALLNAIDQLQFPCEHKVTEIRNAVIPTLSTPGYSGDTYCVECGERLEEGHGIPALGIPASGPVHIPEHSDVSLPFTDVKTGDWYYSDVQFVYSNDLMKGTNATSFSPNVPLTRGMIVTILYRLEGSPETRYNGYFSDVANYQWYTSAVEWAAKEEIVTGYSNGKFGPEDPVTREQLAAILYRYAKSKGENVTGSTGLNGYTDNAAISAYAVSAMQWAVNEELMNGANGKLRPKDSATRAEVAAIFSRFLSKEPSRMK